jgi:hypothetical protein
LVIERDETEHLRDGKGGVMRWDQKGIARDR